MNSEVDVSSSILLGSQDIISIIIGGGVGRRGRFWGSGKVGVLCLAGWVLGVGGSSG